MESQRIKDFQRKIRDIVGPNRSFGHLRRYIEQSEDRRLQIAQAMLVLGDPEIRRLSTWSLLCERFFEYYRSDILRYCGYTCGPDIGDPIVVKNQPVFINRMAEMKKAGVFGKCSNQILSGKLCLVFNTGYKPTTLANMLQDSH